MTIYQAAPGIVGIVIAIGSCVCGRIIHDRAVAVRDARRAAQRTAAE